MDSISSLNFNQKCYSNKSIPNLDSRLWNSFRWAYTGDYYKCNVFRTLFVLWMRQNENEKKKIKNEILFGLLMPAYPKSKV